MTKDATEKRSQIIPVRVNPILLAKFDAVIKTDGLGRSEAIRALMVDHIKKCRDAGK